MNKDIKKGLVPKLRFPEFLDSGDWEEKKLGDLVDIKSGISPSRYDLADRGKYAFLKVEDLNNCAKYQIKSREYSNNTENIIPSNSVIFPKRGAAILLNKVRINVSEVLMDTNLMAISPNKKVFTEFLYYKIVDVGLFKIADTSTIPQINNKHIIPYSFVIPSKIEQTKIAACLSSLDDLITAQTQKIAALKAHKKGLMQQLFPAEGETVPKLRFPEFLGEWEERTIENEIDFLSGYSFDGDEIQEDSSGVNLMRGINITEGFIRHKKEIDRYYLGETNSLEKYLLKENDLVIGMDGSKVGKNSALIQKNDVDTLLVQRVARLRAKQNASIAFIYQHIHSSKFHDYVDKVNTSSGIPHISAKQIKEFKIHFPTLQEQTKIAVCLSSLDELINTHIKKLNALKLHKKGLMQGLFPVSV